ncbi:putative transporter [Paramyrothecium foliicola]|nr:putative transporter [Paramyrothecium foliicola]
MASRERVDFASSDATKTFRRVPAANEPGLHVYIKTLEDRVAYLKSQLASRKPPPLEATTALIDQSPLPGDPIGQLALQFLGADNFSAGLAFPDGQSLLRLLLAEPIRNLTKPNQQPSHRSLLEELPYRARPVLPKLDAATYLIDAHFEHSEFFCPILSSKEDFLSAPLDQAPHIRPSAPSTQLAPLNIFETILRIALVILSYPTPVFLSPSVQDLEILAQNAAESINAYKVAFRDGQLRFFWGTTHNLFRSGVAKAYCIHLEASQNYPNLKLADMTASVNTCQSILWGMVERFPAGRVYRDAFESLVKSGFSSIDVAGLQGQMQSQTQMPMTFDITTLADLELPSTAANALFWGYGDSSLPLDWLTLGKPWRGILRRRIRADYETKGADKADITLKAFYEAILDYRLWLHMLLNIVSLAPKGGLLLYGPTIIRNIGFSRTSANLLNVVSSVLVIVLSWLISFASDRTRWRGPWYIVSFAWSIIFAGVLYSLPVDSNKWTRYAIFTLLSDGNALAQGLNDAWLSINAVRPSNRSIGLAMVVMGSNLGGMAGQQLFR